MRILLATAVALAPLMCAVGAQAQVVISTNRTTPISTSNATGTAADAIRFASGGGITLTTGTAVTIDSSHNVTLDSGSTITMANAADGATAILVNGGNTANLTIGGTISITDSITEYPDTDEDGDFDGPIAAGTGRYGVRLAGDAPVTGNVQVDASGSITVEGNNSYGLALETDLIGDLRSFGTVRAIGENSVGIRTTGDVTGQVIVGGAASGTGLNASAVSVEGDIAGRLTLQGSLASTGYRYTSRGSDEFVEGLEADDLLQSGSAVIIAGNVGGGVVFDTAPPDTDADEDAEDRDDDEDDDGRPDAQEGNSIVSVFGSAPAVTVGSATQSITLGVAGTEANAYGFINRGEINSQGVYDGVSSNGVQFGVAGGQTVTIDGGVLNTGRITTLAQEANSTGVRFGSGVSTPRFVNDGFISAAAQSDVAAQVTGLAIDAGASVPTFSNSGSLLATSGNGVAGATALSDLSGTLTSITNTGIIQASVLANIDSDPITGRAIAIDASANTTGLTLTQIGTPTPTPGEDEPDFADADGDGVSDQDEPALIGDVLLGSGADALDIRNGVVLGDIAFGDGADRLSITGGALVRGELSDTDGLLDIDVTNGTLEAQQGAPVGVTNLNVGSDGNLIVRLDPANGGNSGFNVSGTATLADGAGLGVRFASLIDAPTRFTIIDAATLNFGTIDAASVQENSPYLFVVGAGADVPAGQVFIDVRRRTAQEASLIRAETEAFDAFYAALDDNDALLNAFINQTDRDGFINLYEQMLPDHSGGPLLSLASGVDAVTRALTGRNASAAPGETSAWLQEINFYADKDKTETYGFRSEGFGIAGGVERGTGLGAVGVSLAFTSSDLEDPEAEAEEVLSANLVELGLYWRAQGRDWTTWARAAGGFATFEATRAFIGEGLNLRNESNWNGLTLSAAGGASYERSFGRVNIRPEAYVEYFSLSEDARTEEGGGDGFDLEIEDRDGHLFAAVAAVNIGYGFGQNGWIRPELRLGWRQNISVDPGDTLARFASGGPDFTLTGETIEGGGPIAGLRLNVGNALGMLSIAADAEMIEDYVRYTLLLRASFRF